MSLPKKAAAVGAALGMAATLAVSAPAAAASNYIHNVSNLGLGVIHVQDGNYTHGNYDVVLPRGQKTTIYWANAAGYYIGPGYCAYVWELTGGSWVLINDNVRPGQHYISTTRTIKVDVERSCGS